MNSPVRAGSHSREYSERVCGCHISVYVGEGKLVGMGREREPTRGTLLSHVLVPVANEADARETAEALEVFEPDDVTVMHVVEKGEGVPDKTPVAQSEALAEDLYAAFRSVFPDAATHTTYARDVIDAIFESAEEIDATAIVFRSRGGNRLVQFLSGDHTLKLVTQATRPVIALPRMDHETDHAGD